MSMFNDEKNDLYCQELLSKGANNGSSRWSGFSCLY